MINNDHECVSASFEVTKTYRIHLLRIYSNYNLNDRAEQS